MRMSHRGKKAGTHAVLWAIEIAILVALLIVVGFLESMTGLKAAFSTQGAFFIRLFIVIAWALASFYYNDNRMTQR